ncbi:hypothetical protein RsTz2092_07340 [Deferribacterales bacterium RsTz2092]
MAIRDTIDRFIYEQLAPEVEKVQRRVQDKLNMLDNGWWRTFKQTVAIDLFFIVVAVVCIVAKFSHTAPVLYCIGVARFAWMLKWLIIGIRSIKPYWSHIKRYAPVLWSGIWQVRSFERVTKAVISAVILHYYKQRVPNIMQMAHKLGSAFDVVSSADEIVHKAADDCYPLAKKCFRRIVVVDLLGLVVFYGILAMLAKLYLMKYALV